MLTTPIWIDYMEDYLIAIEPRNGYLETYMKEAHEFYRSGLNEEQMINIHDQIVMLMLTKKLKVKNQNKNIRYENKSSREYHKYDI